jgi:uncharacterized membrane protein
MSSNPDQKPPESEAEAAPETVPPAAPEPVAETPAEPEAAQDPAAELFAAAPLAKVEPEPELEPEPEPEPKAPSEAVTETAPAQEPVGVEDTPLFRSIPSGPRKRAKTARSKSAPAPLSPRDLEPEAGDFDAVFEARSDAGLGDRLTPTVCYLLMVFSPLTLGVAAIPAVVLAYMNRETAPAWMASHYIYQIRTFWASVLIALAAIGTIFFWERGIIALAFGVFFNLVLLLGVAWFVLRAATGLMRLRRAQPIRDPRAWGI